jgi:1-aminocyclopropane-1-carboxylate deaminase/D-cysteine desulfhydrase-like pyridoxal-dependent ACC family enzyme
VDLRFLPPEQSEGRGVLEAQEAVRAELEAQAIRLTAGREGIVLDPVCTGKTMAALMDLIRRGRIPRDELVAFVHTGGTPALFAYSEELTSQAGH